MREKTTADRQTDRDKDKDRVREKTTADRQTD